MSNTVVSCFQFPRSSSVAVDMPTVADLPPPRPVLPAVPPRLLSSASAPALAPAPSTGLTVEDVAAVPLFHNPEFIPGYQESWDEYWSRVRPQKNRPYDKSHLQTPRPKTPKGSCLGTRSRDLNLMNLMGGGGGDPFVFFVTGCTPSLSPCKGGKKNLVVLCL